MEGTQNKKMSKKITIVEKKNSEWYNSYEVLNTRQDWYRIMKISTL